MSGMDKTWDGLPVAPDPPFASCVVVWRKTRGGRKFLVLHRLHAGGPDHHGDWAWTPPAGARLPDETADEAAERELREETGLALPLTPLPTAASDAVALYLAEAPTTAADILDEEHDAFAWLALDEAMERCYRTRSARRAGTPPAGWTLTPAP